ncbi:MAG: hypothetical protein JWQ97_278 [Phenylobacterium sp.]|nr:hypothetical protein [Phenylobacterium sp.]
MGNNRFAALPATFVAVTTLSVGSGAAAQSAAQQPSASQAIEEVVVTARRREERLLDVPASIQAFSGSTLQQYAIKNVTDLTQIAPGLTSQPTVFGKGPMTLSIRGQRQSLANIEYDSPVQIYVNEVVQARTQGLNDALFDLDSVQVLKGPQGTLFGRNTTGGALLFTTKAPTKEFGGYIDGTYGNYNETRLEAALNIPINDQLQVRLAGVSERHDGYIADPAQGRRIDDKDTGSWRLSIRFQPVAQFTNNLVLNGFNEHDSGAAFKNVYANLATVNGRLVAPETNFYRTADFWTSNVTSPPNGTRFSTFGGSNISTLDLGGVTVKNILGYRQVKGDVFFDLDGTSQFVSTSEQVTHERQYSEELQVLGSAFDKKLEYVAGGYFFRENGRETQTTIVSPGSPNNLITDYGVVSKTEAVYAQATYHLPHAISLTAGARYTWDKRRFDQFSRFTSGICRIVDADRNGRPLSPCSKSVGAPFSNPTYNLSIDWKVTDRVLLYFTHRYGYQAGGFTNSALTPSQFIPFQPQTVHDYEIGMKSEWSLGEVRAQTNIALFKGNYKDVQRLLTVFINLCDPTGACVLSPVNRIQNAASSTVKGLDADVRLIPVSWLHLSAAYTYIDAYYKNYNTPTGDFTGSRFAGAPKHTFAGSMRFHLPVPEEIGDSNLQIDGSYQSSTVTQDTTSYDPVAKRTFPTAILKGYKTLNARIDLDHVAGRPLRLSFYVKNLTKEKYYTAGNDFYFTTGQSIRLLGDPRTYAVEANYSF